MKLLPLSCLQDPRALPLHESNQGERGESRAAEGRQGCSRCRGKGARGEWHVQAVHVWLGRSARWTDCQEDEGGNGERKAIRGPRQGCMACMEIRR